MAVAFVAMRLVSGVDAWAARSPVSAAMLFGGAKNSGVDAAVQLATNGGDVRKMDVRRSACFLLFGVGWIGGAQYWIFNRLIPRIVPAANAKRMTFFTALRCGACDAPASRVCFPWDL